MRLVAAPIQGCAGRTDSCTVSRRSGAFVFGENPPSFSKRFVPETIGPGSVSTLEFTITNGTPRGIRGLRFADKLPPGVVIANPANAVSACGGNLSAPAGGNIIELEDGSVPGNGACTITVDVTSDEIGIHTNVSEDLISDAGNSGTATADLSVVEELPGFRTTFEPATVNLGGRSRLTFTIDNTLNEGGRTFLTFTDVLPPGIAIADPPNVTTTCPSSNVTATPGSSTISVTPAFPPQGGLGGAIDAFSACTISLDVVGTAVGLHHNFTGELTSATSTGQPITSSGRASATLRVTTAEISIAKSFTDDPAPPGGVTTLQFTITNRSREERVENIGFTDDLEAMLPGAVSVSPDQNGICGPFSVLQGTSTLKLGGGSLEPGESCSFAVQIQIPLEARSGAYPNATSVVLADVGSRSVEGSPATDILFIEPRPTLEKEFIDDPATPGSRVTLEFRITNTSPTATAENVSFFDELPSVLQTVADLPDSGFCGPSSLIQFTPAMNPPMLAFQPARIAVSGITLSPRETCSFRVILNVEQSASAGIHNNTTSPITALIDDVTVTGRPASNDLVIVGGPQLTKEFLDGTVMPGERARMRFTLSLPPEAPEPAANIRFDDNLDAFIPGATAVIPPGVDICGPGSIIRGESVLEFRGGTLRPGEICSFDVLVSIPDEAPLGLAANTTSPVVADVGGLSTSSAPASATLVVSTLTFEKEFEAGAVVPGDKTELRFTIGNDGPVAATNVAFDDVLGDTLDGLMAEGLPLNNICGDGSLTGSLEGSVIAFSTPRIGAGSACEFVVSVIVPEDAPDGFYVNSTSPLMATIGGNTFALPPATATLEVRRTVLELRKQFTTNPVEQGGETSLEFTLTNSHPSQRITAIAFTDSLPPGLRATGGTQNNLCGAGSSISGTTTITFTGGVLDAGASCTFSVPITVGSGVIPGVLENLTSEATGDLSGLNVRGDPARAELRVDRLSLPLVALSPVYRGSSVLIRWTGTPDRRVCVEWSEDLEIWTEVVQPPLLTGAGVNFWTDTGPPETPSRPNAVRQRFYRVFEKPVPGE